MCLICDSASDNVLPLFGLSYLPLEGSRMQPGDTSWSDETTRTLVLDDWTPVVGHDPFDDDHTTSTWRASPAFRLAERRNIPSSHVESQDIFTTWDDVEQATRQLQARDAASTLGRMAAPRDASDARAHMWASNHSAHPSEAPAPRIIRVAEADFASAQLRAQARERAAAQSRAGQGSANSPAHSVQRMAAMPMDAPARSAPPAQVRVPSRQQTLLGLPGPAQVQARQTQPVAQRRASIAPRFAPIPLATQHAVPPELWLTPRTHRQLGAMSLLPAVALFGAVFAGRVLLLASGGPTLHPAITTEPAVPARVEPAPRTQPLAAAPTVTAPAPQLAQPLTAAPAKPAGHVARSTAPHASSSPHAPRRIEQLTSPSALETSASAPTGEGVLRINSRPWAEVFVDGTPVGNTPQQNLRLPAGAHTVELLNRPMSMNKTLRVVIQPGQTETRIVNLIE
jgi:hypothetical protein